MKFKTKSSMYELEQDHNSWEIPYYKGYNKGVADVFDSFLERVCFYKKYEGKPILFGNKNVDLYIKFKDWHNSTFACFPNYKHTHEGEMYLEIVFNRWLFTYCFGDVIE